MGRLNPSMKKQRKAIFSKFKKATTTLNDQESQNNKETSYVYRRIQSSDIKMKPPSSLTSYIDVNSFRKEQAHNYQINISHQYHEDPFQGGDFIQNSQQDYPNLPSEVKVQISDDEISNRSVTHHLLPIATQDRFFDKETTPNPPKMQ